jgi:HEXXH motif-containing protein
MRTSFGSPAVRREPAAIEVPGFLGESASRLPAAAFALPGGDLNLLSTLEDRYVARQSLRLALLPSRLARLALPDGRCSALATLTETILRLPASERKALLGSVRFVVWLERVLALGARPVRREVGVSELDHHLSQLPLLSLSFLVRAGAALPSGYRIWIPGDRAIGPTDVGWGVRARRGRDVEAELRIDREGSIALHCGQQTLVVPRSSLGPRAPSSALPNSRGARLTIEPRHFVADGLIEVGLLKDFPELDASMTMSLPDGDLEDPFRHVPYHNLSEACCSIDLGLGVLGRLWPAALIDVKHFCRLIVPVCTQSGLRVNASHAGLRFVQSVTVNQGRSLDLAEDVLHESMHSKLWCLSDLVQLVRDDGSLCFHHPWREDPRPITGVLLGAHTFLSVVELYVRAVSVAPGTGRAHALSVLRSRLRSEVGQALEVLERGAEFTVAGRTLMEAMCAAFRDLPA